MESTPRRTPLLAAVAAFGALAIVGATVRLPWLVYTGKPLATLACVVLAARGGGDPAYRRAIVAGLCCSLAGDIFLMLPQDRFIAGLASFLVAHLCYLAALARGTRPVIAPAAAVPYAVAAGALLVVLWPALGDALRAPVAAYAIVLAAMAAVAATRWRQRRTAPAARAALGGAFFVASDATLALDRFRFDGTLPFRAVLVLGTYWIAQGLIASSTSER